MTLGAWVLAALLPVLFCARASGAPPRPQPVGALNVSRYIGRWYQVYASASVQWTMEVGGRCVTADYDLSSERADVVAVQNAVRVLGVGVKVTGYGILNPAHAGELDVSLGPPGHGPDPANAGKFERTNYLVFGLGPVVSGQLKLYDYAMVSDPSGESLYVLARNVTRFEKQYEADVLATLKHLNFTSFLNKPRKSSQEGCKYVPPPSAHKTTP